MAKKSSSVLKSPFTAMRKGVPSLTEAPGNYRGNPSARLQKPHDCGPNDLPVKFTEDSPRFRRQPAKISSPLGPFNGVPGKVRKTR